MIMHAKASKSIEGHVKTNQRQVNVCNPVRAATPPQKMNKKVNKTNKKINKEISAREIRKPISYARKFFVNPRIHNPIKVTERKSRKKRPLRKRQTLELAFDIVVPRDERNKSNNEDGHQASDLFFPSEAL
jgi:hypothetical protein